MDGMQAGFSSVIKKPVEFSEIYSLLSNSQDIIYALSEKQHTDKLFKEYNKAIDSGFMVSKTDPQGVITYANDVFCQVSGYTKEELIGKPHNVVRHPKMSPAAFADMWKTILGKNVWRGKVINKRKDGSPYYVNSVVSPILDENNNIVEFISMRQDITKMVETNQKLLKEQEEKAERARKHFEELEKSKITLLNLFSHELKTPLNAVINLSKIIQRRLDSIVVEEERESTAELVRHIVENSEHMEIMIGNIVEVMKLQSGLTQINLQRANLADFVRDKLSFGKLANKLKIVFEFCTNPSIVTFDQKQTAKILEHIVSNALKYAKTAILVRYTEENGEFILNIEDDGDGFANPNMKIELFGQNDDNFLTRQSSGIGIGLYHSKLCAASNGWQIELSNMADKLGGATVCIRGKII
jgi:PAS domain S-box-containing protein